MMSEHVTEYLVSRGELLRAEDMKPSDVYRLVDAQDHHALQERFDALHAEAEALRGLTPEPPPRPPEGAGMPRYGLRWNGPGQPLSVPMDDGYWTPWHLAEALRAENGRLRVKFATEHGVRAYWKEQYHALRTELEAARGLLAGVVQRCSKDHGGSGYVGMDGQYLKPINAFLTASPDPEVPDHIAEASKKVEQGERQETVVPAKPQWAEIVAMVNEVLGSSVHKFPCENGSIGHEMTGMNFNSLSRVIDRVIHRYTTPQPGPDVRALAEALNFACKSLCQVTSSDGSGHADIALSVLRMAGVDGDERERLVEGWKGSCQWRIDKSHRQTQQGDSNA